MREDHDEAVFVYSTLPDKAAAARIADVLVTARFATRVDIRGPLACVVARDGRMETGEEYAMFAETRRSHAGHAIAAARPLYPQAVFSILPLET